MAEMGGHDWLHFCAAKIVVAVGLRPPPNRPPDGWILTLESHHLIKKSPGQAGGFFMAEMVGFEPTCLSPDKTISSRSRYDHFDTSPYSNGTFLIISDHVIDSQYFLKEI